MKAFHCLASSRICIDGHTTVNRVSRRTNNVANTWIFCLFQAFLSGHMPLQCCSLLKSDSRHSHGSSGSLAGVTGRLLAAAGCAWQPPTQLCEFSLLFCFHPTTSPQNLLLTRQMWRRTFLLEINEVSI